jgi:hypothetical protein
MKRVWVILLFSFLAVNLSANDFSKLMGTWNYKVEYAPEGYDRGQIIFTQKESKVSGEVRIQGQSIPLNEIKYADGQYKFNVTIEYNNIPVVFKVEGDKLTGKANTPDGVMPISGTKEKAAKN